MRLPYSLRWSPMLLVSLAAAACGSSNSSSSQAPAAASNSTTTAAAGSSTGGPSSNGGGSPAALSADAHSAATGDIPDNQVFLVLHDARAGYTIKYPEGWTQRGSGRVITLQDKNNLVRIVVSKGPAPTVAGVAADLRALQRRDPSLTFKPPTMLQVGTRSLVKAVYTTRSAPNPVTGKRVELIVDRYALGGAGKHAIVDLGMPKGVDNVDAYRMMIESFGWR
jgi:hypothetical protein